MVPALGAFMVCSIFMAPRINSFWPFSTTSPALTKTSMILPGMGATTSPDAAAISWPSAEIEVQMGARGKVGLPAGDIVPWRRRVGGDRMGRHFGIRPGLGQAVDMAGDEAGIDSGGR